MAQERVTGGLYLATACVHPATTAVSCRQERKVPLLLVRYLMAAARTVASLVLVGACAEFRQHRCVSCLQEDKIRDVASGVAIRTDLSTDYLLLSAARTAEPSISASNSVGT